MTVPQQIPDHQSVRAAYEQHGAERYYRTHGDAYANPHELRVRAALAAAVREWPLDLSSVLDLAAGSGEVTRCLLDLGYQSIEATDPFTFEAYTRSTGRPCAPFSFQEIAL